LVFFFWGGGGWCWVFGGGFWVREGQSFSRRFFPPLFLRCGPPTCAINGIRPQNHFSEETPCVFVVFATYSSPNRQTCPWDFFVEQFTVQCIPPPPPGSVPPRHGLCSPTGTSDRRVSSFSWKISRISSSSFVFFSLWLLNVPP